MAITKKATSILFLSMSIAAAASIAVGFLVFSLLPTGDKEACESPTEYNNSAEYFLRCMRMLRPGIVNPNRNWFYDSPTNKYDVTLCEDSLILVQFSYIVKGTLPEGYVEALKTRYNNDQSLVEFRICGLDLKRCPDETKALRSRYYDELQIRYKNNQTLVDLHICVLDFSPCPCETKGLLRRYYEDGLDFKQWPKQTKALLKGYYDELPYGWMGKNPIKSTALIRRNRHNTIHRKLVGDHVIL